MCIRDSLYTQLTCNSVVFQGRCRCAVCGRRELRLRRSCWTTERRSVRCASVCFQREHREPGSGRTVCSRAIGRLLAVRRSLPLRLSVLRCRSSSVLRSRSSSVLRGSCTVRGRSGSVLRSTSTIRRRSSSSCHSPGLRTLITGIVT